VEVTGIRPGVGPAEVWRSALETVADTTAAILGVVEGAAGPARRIVASGGWSNSAAFRLVEEGALGDVDWLPERESGALGAARFGFEAADEVA